MAPEASKMGPREAKMCPRGPKMDPRGPLEKFGIVIFRQNGSKRTQDRPKRALRWAKMAP